MATGYNEEDYFQLLIKSEEVVIHIDGDDYVKEETYVRKGDSWINKNTLIRPKSVEEFPITTLSHGWLDGEAQLMAGNTPDTVSGVFGDSSFFSDDQMAIVLGVLKGPNIRFYRNATGDDLDALTDRLMKDDTLIENDSKLSKEELIKGLKEYNTVIITEVIDNSLNISVWCKDIDSWVFVKTYTKIHQNGK